MANVRSIALLLCETRIKESRKIAENREKLAKRRLNRYLRRRPLVSSVFFPVIYAATLSVRPVFTSSLDQIKVAVLLGRDLPGMV